MQRLDRQLRSLDSPGMKQRGGCVVPFTLSSPNQAQQWGNWRVLTELV